MRKLLFCCFWCVLSLTLVALQPKLRVLNWAQYAVSVSKDPNKELINLQELVPNVALDIRYATTNNFVKRKLYNNIGVYARKPVANALVRAQQEFEKLGVGILIYDAYRPYAVTVEMFNAYPDPTYVASPEKGSRHNRGCAIDMGLVDLQSGMPLKMPTEFDSFKREAWPRTFTVDPEIRKNKEMIISVMEKNGFKVNSSEWWHYDFIGWKKYELLDVSFEALENGK